MLPNFPDLWGDEAGAESPLEGQFGDAEEAGVTPVPRIGSVPSFGSSGCNFPAPAESQTRQEWRLALKSVLAEAMRFYRAEIEKIRFQIRQVISESFARAEQQYESVRAPLRGTLIIACATADLCTAKVRSEIGRLVAEAESKAASPAAKAIEFAGEGDESSAKGIDNEFEKAEKGQREDSAQENQRRRESDQQATKRPEMEGRGDEEGEVQPRQGEAGGGSLPQVGGAKIREKDGQGGGGFLGFLQLLLSVLTEPEKKGPGAAAQSDNEQFVMFADGDAEEPNNEKAQPEEKEAGEPKKEDPEAAEKAKAREGVEEAKKAIDELVQKGCQAAFEKLPNFRDSEGCDKFADLLDAGGKGHQVDPLGCLLGLVGEDGQPRENSLVTLWKKTGKIYGALSKIAEGKEDWLTSVKLFLFKVLGMGYEGLGEFSDWALKSFHKVFGWVLKQASATAGCNYGPLLTTIGYQQLIALVEKWLGFEIPKVKSSLDYALNYKCPEFIPSQSEINLLRIREMISQREWECLTRASNNIPHWQEKAYQAQLPRLDPETIIRAQMRGVITAEGRDALLRQLGADQPAYSGILKELVKEIPNPTDLVRFMLRDAFDENTATKYSYDAEFDSKFSGAAEKLFGAHGIDKSLAKFWWRAHWQLPSPGQLYTMLHRLRGERDHSGVFRYFDDKGNKLPAPEEIPDQELKVDEKTVYEILGINDMLPYFRERMIAISRPPLTRTDAQRAFYIDAISATRLYEAYRDLGYDDQNANTLVEFAKRLKAERNARKSGGLTYRSIAAMFSRGEITEKEAREELSRYGVSAEQIDATIRSAEVITWARYRKNCLKGLKKRYMVGEFTEDQIQTELLSMGLSEDTAWQFRRDWRCERMSRSREETATQLCRWYTMNLITKAQFKSRLLRIGYTEDTARLIIRSCQLSPPKVKGQEAKPEPSPQDRLDEQTEPEEEDAEVN